MSSFHRVDERIIVYVADPAKQDIRLYWKNDSGAVMGNFQRLREFLNRKHERLVFAMNGGMFRPDHSPVGLYIENGKLIAPLDTSSGTGNFYLKPNGVFFLTADCKAGVCQTDSFRANGRIRLATQSGPMLVIGGEIHPALRKGSANLNIRNGVGILPDHRILFAISSEPINFYDFALFFKQHGCKDALYLDGFVSKAYIPDVGRMQQDGDLGVMIGVSASER